MFVDLSGRRGRLVRHAGVVAGAACLSYSVILAVGFTGGTAFAPETLIPGHPSATEAFGRKPEGGPERYRPEHRRPPHQDVTHRDVTHPGPRPHEDRADTGLHAPRDARAVALGEPVTLDDPAPERRHPGPAEPGARVRPEPRGQAREQHRDQAREHTPAHHGAGGTKRAAHRKHAPTHPAGRKPGHRAEHPRHAKHAKPTQRGKPAQHRKSGKPAKPGAGGAHTPARKPPARKPPARKPPARKPPAADPPAAGAGLPGNPGPKTPLNPLGPLNPAGPAPGANGPGVPQNGDAPS